MAVTSSLLHRSIIQHNASLAIVNYPF